MRNKTIHRLRVVLDLLGIMAMMLLFMVALVSHGWLCGASIAVFFLVIVVLYVIDYKTALEKDEPND